MGIKYLIAPVIGAVMAVSCSTGGAGNAAFSAGHEVSAKAAVADSGQVGVAGQLPLPEVPAALRDPQARGAYIVEHFWDGMDFGNRNLSLDTAFMEQSFANFASLFEVSGDDAVRQGMLSLVERASADAEACAFLAYVAEKYLYDPNSPMLDERSYIRFAEALTGNAGVDAALKARPEWLLGVALKNRPGSRAADFGFIDRDGKRGTLHEWVRGSSSRVLVVFYDPDCDSCNGILQALASSGRLASAIDCGELRVLAVYPGDDRELWSQSSQSFPAKWEVAIDSGRIDKEELYVFPAMPVLYLLENDVTVIVKDMDYRAVI